VNRPNVFRPTDVAKTLLDKSALADGGVLPGTAVSKPCDPKSFKDLVFI